MGENFDVKISPFSFAALVLYSAWASGMVTLA